MLLKEFQIIARQSLNTIYDSKETEAILRVWLCSRLKLSGYALSLQKNMELSKDLALILEADFTKLKNYTPLYYVLGECQFLGHSFKLNSNVLIPRPETEELVLLAKKIIDKNPESQTIWDIGTGSGCIAISLAKFHQTAKVYATDISTEAIDIATNNAGNLGANVNFEVHDIFSSVSPFGSIQFDIIISNPPYIPIEEKQTLEPHILQHEPHTALFVYDADPLLFYKRILKLAEINLKAGGYIFFECHYKYAKKLLQLNETYSNLQFSLFQDLFNKDRILLIEKKAI